MLNQEFSARNYLRLINVTDLIKYPVGRNEDDYSDFFEIIASKVNRPGYSVSKLKSSNHPHGTVYVPSCPEDEFAFRKANDNIRRLFNVSVPNRTAIVNQVKTLLQERVPLSLIRLDISKFYESISREDLIGKIMGSHLPSSNTKKVIKRLFACPDLSEVRGIPRGISLSNSLSDIYLEKFDNSARKIDGVYYYVRYVDDIAVFCFKDPVVIKGMLEKLLPDGLSFNKGKSVVVDINDVISVEGCSNIKSDFSFDYLGYEFKVSTTMSSKGVAKPAYKNKEVVLGISNRKVGKIKSKLVKAFVEYRKHGDFELLRDRVRFLAGNYRIENKKGLRGGRWKGGRDFSLKAGVYYSYNLANKSCIVNKLDSLDRFLLSLIWSSKNRAIKGTRLKLTGEQKKMLSRFSFVNGFNDYQNTISSFSKKRFNQINNCWRYI